MSRHDDIEITEKEVQRYSRWVKESLVEDFDMRKGKEGNEDE